MIIPSQPVMSKHLLPAPAACLPAPAACLYSQNLSPSHPAFILAGNSEFIMNNLSIFWIKLRQTIDKESILTHNK